MADLLLPLDEALLILERALPPPRWLELRADRDDPAADRSAMDGAALRVEDGRSPRRVAGVLHAGEDPSPVVVPPGGAVRIMTGAVLPRGADAVVPVEQLRAEGESLVPLVDPVPGMNIRRRASQAKTGELLLAAGLPLSAPGVGLRA